MFLYCELSKCISYFIFAIIKVNIVIQKERLSDNGIVIDCLLDIEYEFICLVFDDEIFQKEVDHTSIHIKIQRCGHK
jgi:hypothetical protein